MSAARKNVVLVGATGTLGAALASGFLTAPYSERVNLSLIVRAETATSAGPKKDALVALEKRGAKLLFGDVTSNSAAELAGLVKGNDVIVSAVGAGQLGDQLKLVEAAKLSGVRHFVPSEFGFDLDEIGRGSVLAGLFDPKIDVLDAVKKSGLDWTAVSTGAFGEYWLSPFFGVDAATKTVTAFGSFDTKQSTSPLSDIGLQLADAIVNDRARNQTLHLASATLSYAELHALIERITGAKWAKKVVTQAEAQAAVDKNAGDFGSRFAVAIAAGKGTHWAPQQVYATKYGVQLPKFEDFAKTKLTAAQ